MEINIYSQYFFSPCHAFRLRNDVLSYIRDGPKLSPNDLMRYLYRKCEEILKEGSGDCVQ